jgi:hypothetical protein
VLRELVELSGDDLESQKIRAFLAEVEIRSSSIIYMGADR